MTPGLSSLFWFVAILAAIPLALWLFKRSPMGAAHGSGSLRNVSVLPLSASQRIVTVEVGRGDHRCWLVLGVTPNSINTLHTMLPQDDPTAPLPTPTTAFAQLLSRLKKSGDAS
jgi:flagellar protein FliO/FliZ